MDRALYGEARRTSPGAEGKPGRRLVVAPRRPLDLPRRISAASVRFGMPPPRGHIVVAYALLQYPLRASLADHLYALRRHSRFRTSYINLAVRDVPGWMRRGRFDAVVFHTSFLSNRWD